jgi:hypothetical protein
MDANAGGISASVSAREMRERFEQAFGCGRHKFGVSKKYKGVINHSYPLDF